MINWGCFIFSRFSHSFFLKFCRFTFSISQEIKLRSPCFTFSNSFNLGNSCGIKRKYPFNSNLKGYLANCEGFAYSLVVNCNNNSFIDLDPLFVTFNNFVVNTDCISDLKIDAPVHWFDFLFDYLHYIHFGYSLNNNLSRYFLYKSGLLSLVFSILFSWRQFFILS